MATFHNDDNRFDYLSWFKSGIQGLPMLIPFTWMPENVAEFFGTGLIFLSYFVFCLADGWAKRDQIRQSSIETFGLVYLGFASLTTVAFFVVALISMLGSGVNPMYSNSSLLNNATDNSHSIMAFSSFPRGCIWFVVYFGCILMSWYQFRFRLFKELSEDRPRELSILFLTELCGYANKEKLARFLPDSHLPIDLIIQRFGVTEYPDETRTGICKFINEYIEEEETLKNSLEKTREKLSHRKNERHFSFQNRRLIETLLQQNRMKK